MRRAFNEYCDIKCNKTVIKIKQPLNVCHSTRELFFYFILLIPLK